MFELKALPKSLFQRKNASLLGGILRGIERECLRTDSAGGLAQTPHPASLGSALCHPQITTDFSEALLEFITPPTHQMEDLFFQLDTIHKFSVSQLKDERLWATSMPCDLAGDSQIPVARYGNSNNGRMKTTYRVGLGHRYGRAMQTVAGIHYNFSLPDAFWALLHREQNCIQDLQEFKDQQYFNLIRNFRRHYWLLIYLFGASPALCKSFIGDKPHKLQEMSDGQSLYLPYATSLRMGDLGYQSKVQESLYVCYNTKNDYIGTLCKAITQSHPPYETIGIKDDAGQYQQLNTSILQIENEFYSAIRPKRTARYGETALSALGNRGVEYIEVRCLDVNPFTPFGIDEEQVRFLDTFLLFCALQDSADTSREESDKILRNQKQVVNFGRKPNITLDHQDFGSVPLQHWGLSLIESMHVLAELLDSNQGGNKYRTALEAQKHKLSDSSQTPSAKMIAHLESTGSSFGRYAQDLAKQHDQTLRTQALDENITQRMLEMAEESLVEQRSLEATPQKDFATFLADYYQQYACCGD